MLSNRKKPAIESFEEELSRERAAVLASAGERLSRDLERLAALSRLIEEELSACAVETQHTTDPREAPPRGHCRPHTLGELNDQIRKYNKVREEAMLSSYYLLVTREAMGLRTHKWVEEYYPMPAKKGFFKIDEKCALRRETAEVVLNIQIEPEGAPPSGA